MSRKDNNKKIIENFIKAFTDNTLHEFINYLDNDIEWNIVGLPVIKGKSDFIKAVCSLELKNFLPSNVKNIIAEDGFIVVESDSNLILKSTNNNTSSYCDIYRIKNNKIYELTTYIVDTSINYEKSVLEN